MRRLPYRVKFDGDGGYKIFSRQLYDILKPMGNSHQKRIPRYIYQLSKRQMQIFFDAFVSGDGYVTEHGSIQIRLANEGLTDDLQELITYLGRTATKGYLKTKTGFDVYNLNVSSPKRKYTMVKPRDCRKINYTGKVYCLTVEDNHTFLIRHKGRTHWTGNSENQFFYMLSRNRSVCGVKPYVRATCNPDVDSWVAKFIGWWINPETGYPITERSGVQRYFCRVDGEIKWADTREELVEEYGIESSLCKSVTFIASSVYDNKILLENDPNYLANLHGLSLVERERLLNGNWKIRPAAGLYFKAEQTRIVKSIPDNLVAVARAWDLAATEINLENKNPDRTAGVLMGRMTNGQYIVLDVKRVAANAANVRKLVRSTAETDRAEYNCRRVYIPQDAGQAGKEQAQSYIRELAGFNVKSRPVSGSKIMRAEPFAAQWQQGNVLLLEGNWNETFLDELEGFPDALHDDQVDAASDAFSSVAYARLRTIGRGDFGF